MSKDITIETICVGHPDFRHQEFVAFSNSSEKRIHLTGWHVVWTEIPTGRELHKHVFVFRPNNFFDPREKLFLASGALQNRFRHAGQDPKCPIAHWVIFTGTPKHICSVPHLKVTLYDASGNEIDHRYSHQGRDEPNTRPSIVIGHGRDHDDDGHDAHYHSPR